MYPLLPPTMDFVFKKIFGSENHKDILISFLNAVIKPLSPITEVLLNNSEMTKALLVDKESRLDVRATLQDGEQVNIEIQVADQGNMIKRTLYYWSKMYAAQLGEGEDYRHLQKTICINVLGFNLLGEKAAHNKYCLLNTQSHQALGDVIEFHFLELNKLPNDFTTDELKQHRDMMWLEFLKSPDSDSINTLSESIPELREAKRELTRLSRDDKSRSLYEAREKANKDTVSALSTAEDRGLEKGLEQGIEKGLKQEKWDIAKNLLDVLDVKTIALKTGLTVAEIESLER